jgi:hypothetical protein
VPYFCAEIRRLSKDGFGHTLPLDWEFEIYWVAPFFGILFYIKINDFSLVEHFYILMIARYKIKSLI